ncbi:substrate-binding domain-containing protein [Neptuniibacter caesariensis]|uniref:Molybdate-binding protein n=1 Tax=Neptuniibacter caesariensis TaxID=207954 RepID=A0A7U8GT49_NEPCE|nr:substrate-binding domain-containing protein [Neptuniibacter caesariensis]EAR62066.1 molybdate-binding protein [Oceanospirillum sp. MED92] [Neptuniibacter caesariensis]
MKKWIAAAISTTILATSSVTAVAEEQIIRLATTTSTYNSGLLDKLLPVFEKKHDAKVQVIAVGTGKALRMGQAGDVDVVMTHAPKSEQKFVAKGFGINPQSVMYNDFVLVGPEADPAGIKGKSDVSSALAAIAAADESFISRGDDSGTHKKELSLWKSTSQGKAFSNYKEVGQGMGKVLQMADELNGYTLTDRGTWLAYESRLQLKLLVEGDKRLFNPYQIIQVNPQLHNGLNTKGAVQLSDWFTSTEGQQMINDFRINGKALFHGSAQPAVAEK